MLKIKVKGRKNPIEVPLYYLEIPRKNGDKEARMIIRRILFNEKEKL